MYAIFESPLFRSYCQECGRGYHTLHDTFIHVVKYGKPRKKQIEVGRIRKQKEKAR